jgi:hypothetical protein
MGSQACKPPTTAKRRKRTQPEETEVLAKPNVRGVVRSVEDHGREAFNGIGRLLQTNLNRCRWAQDVMSQSLGGVGGGGLAVAAEPYRVPSAPRGANTRSVNFENTLFVPDLRTNLLSVAKVTDKDCEVVFRR